MPSPTASAARSIGTPAAIAAPLQTQLKQALDAALAEARKVARPGEVELRTGQFSLNPRYLPKGGSNGWVGSTELIVGGRDHPGATRQQETQAIVRTTIPSSGALHFSTRGEYGVRLMVEPGSLRIVSENPDVGEGSEELDVDFAGEPVTIGFNARYLLDVLNALNDDEVALELSGELDPGVIKPGGDAPDFVGVVMAMRI